ncbi:MAG: N-acetyltransferase family protein [Ectobacillus sp.]
MDWTIRKMEQKDIARVQQVAKISWHATYEGIIPYEVQENFLQVAYSHDMMQKRLEGSLIFVAEFAGGIVGFANFSLVTAKGEAELAAIYILPEYQGGGIGTALLKEGIKNLDGIKEIYINVEKENKIGRTFYEAKGFQVIGEFDDDFDGHILQTVRMVLDV